MEDSSSQFNLDSTKLPQNLANTNELKINSFWRNRSGITPIHTNFLRWG